MLFGTGLAFFFGKPFIQPSAPDLPAIPFGGWSSSPQVQAALKVNVLFLIGAALAGAPVVGVQRTPGRPVVRIVGDSADAARAMGFNVDTVRLLATAVGGVLAGDRRRLSVALLSRAAGTRASRPGQGLMAVALVIFARWNPLACFGAALLFGGAGALGPALQSVGVTQGYYLFYAAPYVLTLAHHDRDLLAGALAGRRAGRAARSRSRS